MSTERRLEILSSPGFLIGLSLLLTNDFVLKEQFHNVFTGKLSDFAGLFVFTLFWIAVFPRHRTLICIATAVLFVFWKSAYSQFVIEGWNSLRLFGIQRTVDYTDLWALFSVAFAYFHANIPSCVQLRRRLIYPVALISIVAFTATSFSHRISFSNQYPCEVSRKQLLERIGRLPTNDVHDSFWEGDAFRITFDSCHDNAKISLEEKDGQTVITLNEMEYRCPTKPTPDEMRQHFEREFIDKIREEQVNKSAQVLYVWSTSTPAASNTSTP